MKYSSYIFFAIFIFAFFIGVSTSTQAQEDYGYDPYSNATEQQETQSVEQQDPESTVIDDKEAYSQGGYYPDEYGDDGIGGQYAQSGYYDPEYDEYGNDIGGQYTEGSYEGGESYTCVDNWCMNDDYEAAPDKNSDEYGNDIGGQYLQSAYYDPEYDEYGNDIGGQYTESGYENGTEGIKDKKSDYSNTSEDCGLCIKEAIYNAAEAVKDVVVKTAKDVIEFGESVLDGMGVAREKNTFTELPESKVLTEEERAALNKVPINTISEPKSDTTNTIDGTIKFTPQEEPEAPIFTKAQQQALDEAEKLGLDIDSPVIEAVVLNLLEANKTPAQTTATLQEIIESTGGDINKAITVNAAFGLDSCGTRECQIAERLREEAGLDASGYQIALTREMKDVDLLRTGGTEAAPTGFDISLVPTTYKQGTYFTQEYDDCMSIYGDESVCYSSTAAKYSQSTYTNPCDEDSNSYECEVFNETNSINSQTTYKKGDVTYGEVVSPGVSKGKDDLDIPVPKVVQKTTDSQQDVPSEEAVHQVAIDYLWDNYLVTDFSWKDEQAAERLGMSVRDYVVGGLDPQFAILLAEAGRAMEAEGIPFEITSAFRDDYRQGLITGGVHASVGNSWHGGSNVTEGYGNGLAADINGTAAQAWMEENGNRFGLARPYGDGDPPHVGLASGYESTSRRQGMTEGDVAAIYIRVVGNVSVVDVDKDLITTSDDRGRVSNIVTQTVGVVQNTITDTVDAIQDAVINTGENVSNFFSNLFTGDNENSNNSTSMDNDSEDFKPDNEQPSDNENKQSTDKEASIPSDITSFALTVEAQDGNEYRFGGLLKRVLENKNDDLSLEELQSKFSTSITNKLYLDLNCDRTIEASKVFTVPYRLLLPLAGGSEVQIGEHLPVTQMGLHCFQFEADVNNNIIETNEKNNASGWTTFILERI